jgi:hypothetical protein
VPALKEFVERRERLKILNLAGKIEYDPKQNYKHERNRKR